MIEILSGPTLYEVKIDVVSCPLIILSEVSLLIAWIQGIIAGKSNSTVSCSSAVDI
jgi:hypothetical protein